MAVESFVITARFSDFWKRLSAALKARPASDDLAAHFPRDDIATFEHEGDIVYVGPSIALLAWAANYIDEAA